MCLLSRVWAHGWPLMNISMDSPCLGSRMRSRDNWKKGHCSQTRQNLVGVIWIPAPGSGYGRLREHMHVHMWVPHLRDPFSPQPGWRNRIWLPVLFMTVSVLLVFLCGPIRYLSLVNLCEQPHTLASSEYMLSLGISWTYRWDQSEKKTLDLGGLYLLLPFKETRGPFSFFK